MHETRLEEALQTVSVQEAEVRLEDEEMRIGQKVTVVFAADPRRYPVPPAKFIRCYVIGRVSDGWQLYDPVRDWSWGAPVGFTGRVLVG